MSRHGGNLAAARRAFPRAPEPWIDLSTGISPYAYPFGDLPSACFTRLPEADAEAALLGAARAAYAAPADVAIVAAPGTQILIQLLPRILPARRVAVVGPTYGEHAAAWIAGGSAVTEAPALDAAGDADVVVLVNPNNPDGRLVASADLLDEAARLARRGATLVVDEAFVDVIPGASLLSAGLPDNVLVLRSFGKTYGLAGVRLGFALGSADRIGRLRALLGPWAVPGPALEIGRRALSDTDWSKRLVGRLVADAEKLDALLVAAGLRVVGGTPLFRLAEAPEAAAWFDRLAAAGVLVRPFSYRSDWLRFGIPGEGDWARVNAVLSG
nr:threonine-phosphate decarboxylase CobD [Chthonobacter albigriseus]